MTLLESINGPQDLKKLGPEQIPLLAAEIRDVLIEVVSRTSGHLGPNLGVVELTIALHRVFDSPMDRIVFDTGHQAYVHKLLTGRQAGFGTLRQRGGISGYPSQAESEHDIVENSHASTSLSYADGLAKAYKLRGETGRTVVAVIGDGALTGGMAWEALNNISVARDSRLVIVVNDNGRSYQPTIGGLADHLAAVRVSQRYENVLDYIKTTLPRAPIVGPPLYETLHGIKKGIKDVLQRQVMFEDLGLKYVGPIDGHNEEMVEHALHRAAGFGCAGARARDHEEGVRLPAGRAGREGLPAPGARGRACRAPGGRAQADLVGGVRRRAGGDRRAPPRRGRADRGDAAPHRARPVRARVPGPGVRRRHRRAAGDDLRRGPGHGRSAPGGGDLLDVPEPRVRPGADGRRAAPAPGHDRARPGRGDRPGRRQPQRHVGRLDPAARCRACGSPRRGTRSGWPSCSTRRWPSTGPTAIRYPKGNVGGELEAVRTLGSMDVLHEPGEAAPDVLLIGAGPMAVTCAQAAQRLADQGIGVTVVDPRWLKPLDQALVGAAREHRLVVVVEDNGRSGGFGDAVCRLLRDHDVDTPAKTFGLPQEFLAHGDPRRGAGRGGPHPAAPGPADHRGGGRAHSRPGA